jgi:type IV pilus assembly protein PilM
MLLAPRQSGILRRIQARSTGWIGVDVGAGAIKLAQLERGANHWHLAQTAVVPLPEPGELTLQAVSAGRLAALIRRALSSCGSFRGRRAACVLSPAAVELLTVEVPSAPDEDLRDMIRQELAIQHESARDDFEFDYWNALPAVASGDQGAVALNVLAIRRELAEQAGAELYAAGLTCQELDGTPFTLARAVSLAAGDSAASGAVAMLDWGHASAMFTVIADGQPIFARALRNCGCAGMTGSVAAALNLSDQEACHLLSTCGVPSDTGHDSTHRSTHRELQEFIAELVHGPIEEILGELNKTLAFLKHQSPELAPGMVWLAGGGAIVRNIGQHLEAGLGVTVQNWRPMPDGSEHELAGDSAELPVELFANAAALSLLGAIS